MLLNFKQEKNKMCSMNNEFFLKAMGFEGDVSAREAVTEGEALEEQMLILLTLSVSDFLLNLPSRPCLSFTRLLQLFANISLKSYCNLYILVSFLIVYF